MLWEAAKALGKTPGEIWRLPAKEKRFIFAAIRVEFEKKYKQKVMRGGDLNG
ncbi:hypothetical protein [Desulfotruncus arcticus]|uniref:hypothetical protein n=1 Tax=Desulfotruncus arcticus TaxID=341036 RepID=UPI0013F4EE34|nr:hypothetical protein [Desulfotruncus arcticus]